MLDHKMTEYVVINDENEIKLCLLPIYKKLHAEFMDSFLKLLHEETLKHATGIYKDCMEDLKISLNSVKNMVLSDSNDELAGLSKNTMDRLRANIENHVSAELAKFKEATTPPRKIIQPVDVTKLLAEVTPIPLPKVELPQVSPSLVRQNAEISLPSIAKLEEEAVAGVAGVINKKYEEQVKEKMDPIVSTAEKVIPVLNEIKLDEKYMEVKDDKKKKTLEAPPIGSMKLYELLRQPTIPPVQVQPAPQHIVSSRNSVPNPIQTMMNLKNK